MPKSLKYMLLSCLMAMGSSAWSDCACFCVDGERVTLCTEAGKAQDDPDLCPAIAGAGCPREAGVGDSASYESPSSEAVNCRDVRVYDAVRGGYVTARACDVI